LFLSVLFLLIFIILMLIRDERGYTRAGENDDLPDIPDKVYGVFAVPIPDNLDFADEIVPLNQIDVRESLDREILVNTYFHSQTLLYLKRVNRFFPVIESILKKYSIPEDFKYLAVAESGLTNAISPSNAIGYWQFLEGTAKEYGLEVNKEIDERYHLEKSTEAACKYLLESYKRYGNWTMAAASYNAGRKLIDTQIERQKETDYYNLLLGDETGRYIFRILSYKLILSDPASYGFYLGSDDLYHEIPCFEVNIEGSIDDFAAFAKSYGISYKILKFFNPWLRESFLNNTRGKTYFVKIPRYGINRTTSMIQDNPDSLVLR